MQANIMVYVSESIQTNIKLLIVARNGGSERVKSFNLEFG